MNKKLPKSHKQRGFIPILVILAIVIVTGVISGGGMYFYTKMQEQKKSGNAANPNIPQPQDTANSASLNSTDLKNWEKVSVDNTWNLYKMTYLGFSIKIPKEMYFPGALCTYSTKNGDHSYRPQGGIVPVTLLNKPGNAVFVNATYSALAGESVDDGRHYYSKCNKTVVDFDNLNDDPIGTAYWDIKVKQIENDADLLAFARDNFGSSCTVKKTAAGDGIYDVSIVSDGKDLGESGCPINYMYAFKYSPEKKLAVTWALGQACTFVESDQFDCNDDSALKSFKFL